MANKKYNLEEIRELRKEWQSFIPDFLSEEKRKVFMSRKQAVDLYIDGVKLKEIEAKTNIGVGHIAGFVSSCLETNDYGMIKGYSALIPYEHYRQSERAVHSNSTRGLFNKLLLDIPELKDYIIGNYTGKPNYTTETAMSITALHHKFLLKCRQLGLGDDDYPFNTVNKGERSLRRFLNDYESSHSSIISTRIDDNARQKLKSTGIGERFSKNAVIPYSCVQVDGHIIDMVYATEVELSDGRTEYMTCSRCWIFAIIDVATRAIIGYSMSQELNYNQYDVLRAIKNSILPHKRIDIDGYTFPENGGFPSTAFPELENAVFGTIMLDNAKSHLAKNVVEKLVTDLNITINFGSVATPETRGIVERLFGTLEKKGYHRMPSTTGSNQHDIKKSNPEKAAVKYQITYDDICSLTEILIGEYNNSSHSSLLNRTPLEEMKSKLDAGMYPIIANDIELKKINRLLYETKEVTVRGNKESGKRPYVQYLNAEYRNNILSSNFSYISQKIMIVINPDDLSTVEAYLPDGTSIGKLKANGEYGTISHSLKSRRLINQFANENKKKYGGYTTAVSDFEKELKNRASKNKKARTRKNIIDREIKNGRTEDCAVMSNQEAYIDSVSNTVTDKSEPYIKNKYTSAEEIYNLILANRNGGRR